MEELQNCVSDARITSLITTSITDMVRQEVGKMMEEFNMPKCAKAIDKIIADNLMRQANRRNFLISYKQSVNAESPTRVMECSFEMDRTVAKNLEQIENRVQRLEEYVVKNLMLSPELMQDMAEMARRVVESKIDADKVEDSELSTTQKLTNTTEDTTDKDAAVKLEVKTAKSDSYKRKEQRARSPQNAPIGKSLDIWDIDGRTVPEGTSESDKNGKPQTLQASWGELAKNVPVVDSAGKNKCFIRVDGGKEMDQLEKELATHLEVQSTSNIYDLDCNAIINTAEKQKLLEKKAYEKCKVNKETLLNLENILQTIKECPETQDSFEIFQIAANRIKTDLEKFLEEYQRASNKNSGRTGTSIKVIDESKDTNERTKCEEEINAQMNNMDKEIKVKLDKILDQIGDFCCKSKKSNLKETNETEAANTKKPKDIKKKQPQKTVRIKQDFEMAMKSNDKQKIEKIIHQIGHIGPEMSRNACMREIEVTDVSRRVKISKQLRPQRSTEAFKSKWCYEFKNCLNKPSAERRGTSKMITLPPPPATATMGKTTELVSKNQIKEKSSTTIILEKIDEYARSSTKPRGTKKTTSIKNDETHAWTCGKKQLNNHTHNSRLDVNDTRVKVHCQHRREAQRKPAEVIDILSPSKK